MYLCPALNFNSLAIVEEFILSEQEKCLLKLSQ